VSTTRVVGHAISLLFCLEGKLLHQDIYYLTELARLVNEARLLEGDMTVEPREIQIPEASEVARR